MTGKLIKYEIRSSIKMMAVIWAALIAVSVLFSLSINFLSDLVIDSGNGINTIVGIVEIITGIMYFAVFVALVVATVVMIILRFYKGLLGDEGYLMHTLPVKPWQLITSKGIVAAIVVIGSIIIAFLSIMILAGINSVGIFPEMFGVRKSRICAACNRSHSSFDTVSSQEHISGICGAVYRAACRKTQDTSFPWCLYRSQHSCYYNACNNSCNCRPVRTEHVVWRTVHRKHIRCYRSRSGCSGIHVHIYGDTARRLPCDNGKDTIP